MIDYDHGVTLREINSRDLEVLRSWRNQYEVSRWCRQYSLISDRDQSRWFEWQNDSLSTQMFIIQSENAPVGVCGLTSIDLVNRRAEFSCYIAPGMRGNGYASGALKTLYSFGFLRLGLNVIWGESFDGNPATKIFERLGMIYEGTRKEFYFREGKFIDAHLYSINKLRFDIVSRSWISDGGKMGQGQVVSIPKTSS